MNCSKSLYITKVLIEEIMFAQYDPSCDIHRELLDMKFSI